MDLRDELSFGMHAVGRSVLRLGVAFAAVAVLLFAGVSGIIWWVNDRAQPPTLDEVGTTISWPDFAYSSVEVLDCARTGETCEQYDAARQYLIDSSGENGITYTPLDKDDPGTANDDGSRTITLTEKTPDAQWDAFLDAATRKGTLSAQTTSPSRFTQTTSPTGTQVSFTFGGEALDKTPGQMRFTSASDDTSSGPPALTAITVQATPDADATEDAKPSGSSSITTSTAGSS